MLLIGLLKWQGQRHCLTNVWCERTSRSVSRLKPSRRSSNRSTISTFACKQPQNGSYHHDNRAPASAVTHINKETHTDRDKQIQRQRQWYGKQTTGVAVVYSINSSTHYTPATYSQRILYKMSQNIDPLIRCCCLYISLQFNPLNSANISS